LNYLDGLKEATTIRLKDKEIKLFCFSSQKTFLLVKKYFVCAHGIKDSVGQKKKSQSFFSKLPYFDKNKNI